jgi:flavin reductase (DIM6/NTAB) family NADH-FMN oxidoreductase RutF
MSAGDAARLLGRLDYPMFVVTAADGDERGGCLVGFVTQTSIHPTRLLVCLSRKNRTVRIAERSAGLAVHVVPSDREDLAELFGGETGDEVDKFARCAWHDGPLGLPVIEGCPSWLAGRVLQRLDLGDHVGHLLDPVDGRLADDPADGLDFHRARVIEPGHEA